MLTTGGTTGAASESEGSVARKERAGVKLQNKRKSEPAEEREREEWTAQRHEKGEDAGE